MANLDREGFVYVLQMEGFPYYKIGRTKNLSQRIAQISPQMPGRLRVLFAHRVRDCFSFEAQLHDQFRRVRLNGEWFHLQPSYVEEIRLNLLYEQSERLFALTLERLSRADYEGYDAVRCARQLYRATKRRERRCRDYCAVFSLNVDTLNNDAFRLHGGDVLDAEFIHV